MGVLLVSYVKYYGDNEMSGNFSKFKFSLSHRGVLCVFLYIFFGYSYAAPQYTITDLGVLNGGDKSQAFSVNDSGIVVGVSTVLINNQLLDHSFLFDGNSLHDLMPSTARHIDTNIDINNSGQVVGSFSPLSTFQLQAYIANINILRWVL